MSANASEFIAIIRELQRSFASTISLTIGDARPRPKIIGTLCLGAPVELIDAIGALPIRLMPAIPEAELRGGRFLSSDSCSFCKAVLGGLDRGDLKPDAVLGATTCDQMRRNLEIIARDLRLPVFIFNSPRTADNPLSREFAREELIRLADEISFWSGVGITSENLTAAISRRQLLRQRLAELVGARCASPLQVPRLTGSEFFALMQLFQTISLDFFEANLSRLEELVTRRESLYRHPPLRLALLGSCIGSGDDQIISLIEESGRAVIAYDAICTGRYALREHVGARHASPAPDDHPFELLLSLYHDQIHCPYRRPNDHLFEDVAEDIKHLDIQGVVYKTLKFCHPWGFEARRFKDLLGLPFLHLDHDLSGSTMGQMRTRIEAFIEQLSLQKMSR